MLLPRALLVLALVALALGLGAGFAPLSAQGENCGSAFIAASGSPDVEPTGDEIRAVPPCEFTRSMLRVPAVVALVAGFGLLIGWGLTHGRKKPETGPYPDQEP
ncbi:hypothetical protein [Nonomuraea sp. B19D2]|uniref:hypothetical protein n=1 Tax=Nonomuraea sp. B19D2 TaxID=3159561 RepID=UPI0032DA7789